MALNTRSFETRFMSGNIDLDGEIFDILCEEHEKMEVIQSNFQTDDAIYSNGFVRAIDEGKIPMLELYDTDSHTLHNELKEYHHVIIDNVCYNVYFKDAE